MKHDEPHRGKRGSSRPSRMEVYCMRCKTKTPTNNIEVVNEGTNHPRVSGTCSVCGTKKSQFIPVAHKKNYQPTEGTVGARGKKHRG